jgi:hypothetical protein
LISSARTTFANSGPGRNSKRRSLGSKIETPMMSDGKRSDVNWMRAKRPPATRARAEARVVFPTPGTSSRRRWPRARSVVRARRTTSGFPRSARETSTTSRSIVERSRIGGPGIASNSGSATVAPDKAAPVVPVVVAGRSRVVRPITIARISLGGPRAARQTMSGPHGRRASTAPGAAQDPAPGRSAAKLAGLRCDERTIEIAVE